MWDLSNNMRVWDVKEGFIPVLLQPDKKEVCTKSGVRMCERTGPGQTWNLGPLSAQRPLFQRAKPPRERNEVLFPVFLYCPWLRTGFSFLSLDQSQNTAADSDYGSGCVWWGVCERGCGGVVRLYRCSSPPSSQHTLDCPSAARLRLLPGSGAVPCWETGGLSGARPSVRRTRH